MPDEQQQGANDGSSSGSSISSITVNSRIPAFWRDRPALWFIQFEAISSIQKATDQQKAQLLIAQLDKTELEQISDIVENMPDTGKYEALKKRLKEAFEESTTRKLQRLLEEMDIGDQKPSQLLRRMKDTAGRAMSDDALKLLWIGRLPANIRPIVQASSDNDVDSLAKLADRAAECIRPSEVNSVQSSTVTNKQFEELQAQINAIQQILQRRPFERRGFQGRSRSRSRDRGSNNKNDEDKGGTADKQGHCFYHKRFGASARKCTKPCSFKPSN